MGSIGILCERVRKEEKEIIEALNLVGLSPLPVPPQSQAVPIGNPDAGSNPFAEFDLLIDRCRERTSGSRLISVIRDCGTQLICGGLASQGNRLEVARTLARSGIPRPRTMLASSEEAGMAAMRSMGFPATLLSLSPNKSPQPVFDEDIAEAVLEHRHTLLAPAARSMLVQAGSPSETELVTVVVAGGKAVASAASGRQVLREQAVHRLAEEAAQALNADIVGIQIADLSGDVVVWDVDPVPDFRGMVLNGEDSVGQAIARLVTERLAVKVGQEVGDGIALTV